MSDRRDVMIVIQAISKANIGTLFLQELRSSIDTLKFKPAKILILFP